VELDKVLGKSKRMILPEEELARINKILQRANDKAEGKLDLSNLELTEDNPDGLDISLYKGEDQLDEIDRRRTGAKEIKEVKEAKAKKTKPSSVKKVEKNDIIRKKEENTEDINIEIPTENKINDAKIQETEKIEPEKVENNCVAEAKPNEDITNEVPEDNTELKKKPKGRVKKISVSSEEFENLDDIENDDTMRNENGDTDGEDMGSKKGRRRATKNICYNQFDFLEEDDDEVMPVPKKRKSQDSITKQDESKSEMVSDQEETDEKTSNPGEEKPFEELSTSERALIAEKARMEAYAKQNAEPPTSDDQQPVKKRGRKPKPKE